MTTLKTMVTDWIRVKTQGSHPATPAAGYGNYYDYGGAPYFKNAAGTEISLTAVASDTTGWTAAASAWSYTSADAPTFVITTAADETGSIGVGMRIKLTQTTAKYFIVTAITNSTITVYGGTDYTLISAAISSPYFSAHKAPLGFPTSPLKWTVEVLDTAAPSQASPTDATWYNLGTLSISVPIGCWSLGYKVQFDRQSSANIQARVSLSTANNSESTVALSSQVLIIGVTRASSVETNTALVTAASKTPYYLIAKIVGAGGASLDFRGDVTPTIIRAVCAYL